MSNQQIPACVPENADSVGDILGIFKQYHIQVIESKAAVDTDLIHDGSPRVTDENAGIWLDYIRESSMGTALPHWPTSLDTLEKCKTYVSARPEIVNLLEDVRQKQAYAWLVKEVIAPPPPPPPSLRSIIFPTEPLFSEEVDPGHPPRDNSNPTSTQTHEFAPSALDRSRIPVTIHDLQFIDRAREHLADLLMEHADILDNPIKFIHQSHLEDIRNKIEKYYPVESDVKEFATHMSSFIEGLYREFANRRIGSRTERATINNFVRTDRILIRDDETVVLWEDKAGQVLHSHWTTLRNELSPNGIQHYNLQCCWEGWAAILGKLAWHGSDGNKYLNWATVFSGRHFAVVFIAWIEDLGNKRRPHLFCSPEYPVNHPSLPFSSALLYLLLAVDIDQATLLNKFGLCCPSSTEPILQPRTSRKAALEKDIHMGKALCLVFDLPHLVPQPILPLHQTFEPPTDISSLPVLQVRYKEETTFDDPPITYRHTYASVSGQYFVKIIGKISTQNTDVEMYVSKWVKEEKESRKVESGSRAIVEILGLYHGIGFDIIITAFSGESLVSFDDLPHDDRIWIYDGLLWLHHIHVKHGDFAPRNVVKKSRSRPVIIDFSHSALQHECLGSEQCPELIEAQKMLRLSELHVQGQVSTPPSPWNTAKMITFQARLRWLRYFIAGILLCKPDRHCQGSLSNISVIFIYALQTCFVPTWT